MGQESHFGFVCDPTKGIAPQTACPAGAIPLAAGADIKQLDAEIGNQNTSHLSDVAMAHASQDPNFVNVVLQHSQR